MSVAVNNWSSYNFNIKVFPSKKDMIDIAQKAIEFNDKNIKRKGRKLNYSSEVDSFDLDNMLNEKFYEDSKTLNEAMIFFDKLVAETDMGGAFKKARLRITDDTKGIFDFSLASKGLYRAIEYYSKELEKDSPKEFDNYFSGIVPDKFVKNKKIFNVTSFYYKSKSGKEYELTQQQEGTREMLSLNPQALIKKTKSGLIYTEPTTYVNPVNNKKFSLKFKTKTKKSYLIFEKKGGKAKMIELYFPIHGSVKLVHILPMLLVAKYLKQSGISTRINILRMYHEGRGLFVMYGYPIKDYGDEIDFNEIALNGVDNRWWYSMRVMVRAINDNETAKNKLNLGLIPDTQDMRMYNGQGAAAGGHSDYVEVFSRYRNWYMEQIKKGVLAPLRVDKKLILFGGVWGKSGKFTDLKEDIIKEFFRILDTVDFQFNNAEETCKRIYKRMVLDKLDEHYLNLKAAGNLSNNEIVEAMARLKTDYTYEFKYYVQNLLISTYSYPVGGQYAETDESAKKLDEEFNEKIDSLNNFLKTI